MKRTLPLLVLSLAAAVGAWASHGNGDAVEKGKDFFAGFGCQRCHTIAGEGGEYGPDLTYVGFRVSKVHGSSLPPKHALRRSLPAQRRLTLSSRLP